MEPNKSLYDPQGDLFKTELVRIIDKNHPLVRLGGEVDWERLEEVFGTTYCEDNGHPGTPLSIWVTVAITMKGSAKSMWTSAGAETPREACGGG